MIKIPPWPVPLGYKPIDLGLERIKEAMKRLNILEKDLPPIIHVAGTNGKGSTIAFLRSFLEKAGHKVHCYTSPNLVYFNERIVLAGKLIEDDYLLKILEECRIKLEGIKLTFFEATTAAAFIAFKEHKADVLLLETGVGGRLDATNVFAKPRLTIITQISIDHIEFLGGTIKSIAAEKAAIIKPGVPCIVSSQPKEVMEIIEQEAKRKKSKLIRQNEEWQILKTEKGFTYASGNLSIDFPPPNLPGNHQLINAGTAIAAAENLQEFNISKNHLKKGVVNANWPGRLQKIDKGKLVKGLPENVELWLDGAHNIGGAEQLSNWVKSNGKPVYMVFGMLRKKDIAEYMRVISEIKNLACLCGVSIPDEPKSYAAEDITRISNEFGINSESAGNIEEAVKKMAEKTTGNAIILICGSLYLVGAALAQNNQ